MSNITSRFVQRSLSASTGEISLTTAQLSIAGHNRFFANSSAMTALVETHIAVTGFSLMRRRRYIVRFSVNADCEHFITVIFRVRGLSVALKKILLAGNRSNFTRPLKSVIAGSSSTKVTDSTLGYFNTSRTAMPSPPPSTATRLGPCVSENAAIAG